MTVLIELIIKAVFKGLTLAARVALSRTAIIITFAATIGTTFTAIYSSLSDVSSTLSTAVQSVENLSQSIEHFLDNNDYFSMISYALSLDVLVDGVVTALFWVVVTLGGFLLTALFTVFVSVAPLLAELVVSSLRHQFAKSANVS